MGRVLSPEIIIPYAKKAGARRPIVRDAHAVIKPAAWLENWKLATQWKSQSGGWIGTAVGSPIPLTSLPGFGFDGANDYFTSNLPDVIVGSADFTLIFVARLGIIAINNFRNISGTHNASVFASGWNISCNRDAGGGNTGRLEIVASFSGLGWDILFGVDNFFTSTSDYVIGALRRKSSVYQWFKNGSTVGSSLTKAGSIGVGANGHQIGASGSIRKFLGDICMYIPVAVALSDRDIAAFSERLKPRFGIS